jgi:predicted lactoylglutathione lyase
MKPVAVVVSLPITDLGRSLRFYRDGLGLETAGVDDGIIAFELPNLSLFLIDQKQYATYSVAAAGLPTPGAVIVSCAIGSRAEVDESLARATAAGGTVAAPATETDGSYMGYFSDPDGHLWELVFNARTEQAAAER